MVDEREAQTTKNVVLSDSSAIWKESVCVQIKVDIQRIASHIRGNQYKNDGVLIVNFEKNL